MSLIGEIMDILMLMLIPFIGYIVMYRVYGRFLSKRIFNLSEENIAPSVALEDGIDYVPTKKEIIFGHHYTSIAGTGPIVGPAIAVIWGWIPAIIWIFVGSVVMGAVHDLGSLVISMRNEGKSISEYTAKYLNNRTKLLFFAVVFLELWIVIAIFGLVIAIIFKIYPSSVFPVWAQIPIAITLGHLVYKKGKNITIWSIFALILMYVSVVAGYYFKFEMPSVMGIPPTGVWTIILLIYAFIASVLPVTFLLQPRDYINAYQLIVAMTLLILGVFGAVFLKDMSIVAPAFNSSPKGAPPLLPFLFITIACGAISGFHSLVSSGTSSKQVISEKDALFVGYGSMLMEGVLAILVLIAVAGGIGLGFHGLSGTQAWQAHYESWNAAKGLGSKIGAFVMGSSNMITTLGIPRFIAITIMGVFVSSFASTTLDSATRIQRYVVSELFVGLKLNIFKNRFVATAFAVLSAAMLAFITGADGKGALSMWPLFGAVNQTLSALALIIITLYLRDKGSKKWLVAGLPAIFMTIVTVWAAIKNEISFINSGKYFLTVVNSAIIIIVIWIAIEGLIKFFELGKLAKN